MKLPHGLTTQQIRVLQEFRRNAREELNAEEVSNISHPGGGGGTAPAVALVEAGFLTSSGDSFHLTERAREFLARPAVPMNAPAD